MSDDIARDLQELKEKLEDTLFDIESIVNECPDRIKNRAQAYWLAHIKIALGSDHGYVASSMCSMSDTIGELHHESAEERNYDDEDYDDED